MLREIAVKIGRLIRSIDIFATKQFVNYQGKDSYTTFSGGVISALIYILILALGINEFIIIIN
jgi:hypothetical protein